MWYVYILQSKKDHDRYVGMTDDLRNRVSLHNSGKVFATKTRIPFSLIYFEVHCDKHDAAKREQFLKTGWGKNWIERTLSGFLQTKKLGG